MGPVAVVVHGEPTGHVVYQVDPAENPFAQHGVRDIDPRIHDGDPNSFTVFEFACLFDDPGQVRSIEIIGEFIGIIGLIIEIEYSPGPNVATQFVPFIGCDVRPAYAR